jgi:hypothetical protein
MALVAFGLSAWMASQAAAQSRPSGQPLRGGVPADRVAAIAAMLPDRRFGFGPPIEDRAAWEALAAKPAMAKVIADAEAALKRPVPAMTEQVYLLYRTTGKRTEEYNKVRAERHGRVTTYALAECLENKGRFVQPLNDLLLHICDEPTWVYNFHDPELADWKGQRISADLGATLSSGQLALAVLKLEGKLDPKVVARLRAECKRRVLDPYREVVEGRRDGSGWWWITTTNNWNAVCHNGVLNTALAVLDDRQERAFYVAAAEKYLQSFLDGFGPDGYCAEGMGYWNYGFGNFAVLAELVRQATGGKLDFFAMDPAKLTAQFPDRLAIVNGVVPSYADCVLNTKPTPYLYSYLQGVFNLPPTPWTIADLTTRGDGICTALCYSFPNSATRAKHDAAVPVKAEIRTYFDHGGVLTCRPTPGSSARMGVSLKGGSNDEPHNHNDLGSYVVAVGAEPVLLDPGGEVYTARTFGKDRYQSKLLGSFGHPVPVLAGKQQRAGKEARATVVAADFTPERDTYALDLTSAYVVPELQSYVRTFTYARAGDASLTVADEVKFSTPQTYENALITYGTWQRDGESAVIVRQKGEAVRVTIDTAGAAFTLADEQIDEQTTHKQKPTRVAIRLSEPTAHARVTLTITPLK